MNDLKIQDDGDPRLSTGNFIVPFEQNRWFTGRKAFLEILKQTLFDQAPKKYNHRVALSGMGGIGKTQIALEYVYTNRSSKKESIGLQPSIKRLYSLDIRILRQRRN